MYQSHEFWESNQDGVGCYKSDAKRAGLFAPWAEGILACSQGSTSKVHTMSKKNRKKNSIWLLLIFFFIAVLVWSPKHQVQTMGRRCQRVNVIDRKVLRMWAVPRRVIFWSSSMLTVPGILSTHFSSLFLMTPSAPMTTGIISVPVFHILAISISKSLHLETLLTTLMYVFLSDGTAISIICISDLCDLWLWYLVY